MAIRSWNSPKLNPMIPYAGFNPIEFKKDVTSKPLKLLWEHMNPNEFPSLDLKNPDRDTSSGELALIALYSYVGAWTIAANVGLPAQLIHMGQAGDRYFSHLSYAKNSIGWPMPRFNYVTPGSPASKVGFKVAGKTGARVAGRLIPGVGWALLAYDVYDVAVNRSLWGFDLD